MSLYQSYDMAYCDRCHGQRPHSKRGNCLASHRGTPLATVTPIKRAPLKAKPTRFAVSPFEQNDCGCTTLCQTGCILFGPCPPQAPRPKITKPVKKAPKPRRTFDQARVRAAIAGLLAGELTLQQACRDAGCDTEYLHRKAWQAAKEAISKRDDGRCQYPECDTGGWVKDVHHRITKGSGGSSNPLVAYYLPNLILLCRSHHQLITEDPLLGMQLGLVIPRGGLIHDPAHVPAQTLDGLVLYAVDGSLTIVAPPGESA